MILVMIESQGKRKPCRMTRIVDRKIAEIADCDFTGCNRESSLEAVENFRLFGLEEVTNES
jgi:hypothetical protein